MRSEAVVRSSSWRPSQNGQNRPVADTILRGRLLDVTLGVLSEGIADRSFRDERTPKLFGLPQIERYPPFDSLFCAELSDKADRKKTLAWLLLCLATVLY
jgi:hypothetical protein